MKNILFTVALLISFVSFGQTYEEYLDSGYSKLIDGDYNGSIIDFTKAIETDDYGPKAYIFRARAKDSLKDYDEAIRDLGFAIALYPEPYTIRSFDKYNDSINNTEKRSFGNELAAIYLKRAELRSLLNYNNSAISDYNKILELNPNKNTLAFTYNNRARLKHKLEDYEGAILDYTKAIEINTNNGDYYFNRALSKRFLEDYKGAILDCAKAIEINPNDGDAYSIRGFSKMKLGDISGACADAKEAVRLGNTSSSKFISKECN